MDSISKKITSRPGFSKAILVIREKIVCFKEGRNLFSDDGLHCFIDEWMRHLTGRFPHVGCDWVYGSNLVIIIMTIGKSLHARLCLLVFSYSFSHNTYDSRNVTSFDKPA